MAPQSKQFKRFIKHNTAVVSGLPYKPDVAKLKRELKALDWGGTYHSTPGRYRVTGLKTKKNPGGIAEDSELGLMVAHAKAAVKWQKGSVSPFTLGTNKGGGQKKHSDGHFKTKAG